MPGALLRLLLVLLLWPGLPALAQETGPVPGPAPATYQEARPAQVVALVRSAQALVRAEGLEALIRAVDDPKGPFCRGVLSLFVLDADRGVLLADPKRPALKGRPVFGRTDAKGKDYYRSLADLAERRGRGWSDHFIIPPGGEYADIEAVYVEAIPGTRALVGGGLFDLDAATARAQSTDRPQQ